ncbi:MAG TPA: TIGR03619 family F420-dependent LLM class oxidoreductase [Candidatus Kryptonia bacterium]|nr:TIGR03619 family F420-dependent LLM class oxidoreductase [Candidatus Kryptonia bacterium]
MNQQSADPARDRPLQIGLLLGGIRPAAELGRLAAVAEENNFDSVWVGDHIAFPAPILDPLTTLACFAAHTQRVKLGTCVYLLPLRHPTTVAKSVASLDVLSSGRVIFGVGVGGEFPAEFEASGVPVRERGARADEGIRVLRALWRGEPAGFDGRFHRFGPIRINPPPLQPGGPPIWIGGRSDAALRRAARLGDGWVGYLLSPEQFAERMATIRSMAAPPRVVTGAMMVFTALRPTRTQALQEAGAMLGAMYGRNMQSAAERYCLLGSIDDIAAGVERYYAAGVRHLVLTPLVYDTASLSEQIATLGAGLASLWGR